MKRRILIPVFLFSVIFNVVFILDLLSDRHSEQTDTSNNFKLSADQEKKISNESFGILNENKLLETELENCRQDLYNLLYAEKVDKGKVKECITKISDLQKKIQLNTVDQILIYKTHMTKEQCKCLLEELGLKLNVKHQCDDTCNCSK